MNINGVQGANAYTNVQNTTPPADTAKLRDQNLDASRTEPNQENTTAAQQAFEVNITQEAQQILAAENNEKSAEVAAQQPEDQDNPNTGSAHKTSQIVNIVA